MNLTLGQERRARGYSASMVSVVYKLSMSGGTGGGGWKQRASRVRHACRYPMNHHAVTFAPATGVGALESERPQELDRGT